MFVQQGLFYFLSFFLNLSLSSTWHVTPNLFLMPAFLSFFLGGVSRTKKNQSTCTHTKELNKYVYLRQNHQIISKRAACDYDTSTRVLQQTVRVFSLFRLQLASFSLLIFNVLASVRPPTITITIYTILSSWSATSLRTTWRRRMTKRRPSGRR